MRTYSIAHGPDKFDFVLSLSDGDVANRHPVVFKIFDGGEINVVINTIQRGDEDSDYIWKFVGKATYGTYEAFNIPLGSEIVGFYNTSTRQGEVRI